jgi:hypothetical protein
MGNFYHALCEKAMVEGRAKNRAAEHAHAVEMHDNESGAGTFPVQLIAFARISAVREELDRCGKAL